MNTSGIITGINGNLIKVEVDGVVHQNETASIALGKIKLLAEVIRVTGKTAFLQVYESTRGLRFGNKVYFERQPLEVQLGPGMLKKKYDGLQNDLEAMPSITLNRGTPISAFDPEQIWDFKPLAKIGDQVKAGDLLGIVQESWLEHKIMVPFHLQGTATIHHISKQQELKASDTVATLECNGQSIPVGLYMRWPIKEPCQVYQNRHRPDKIFHTGVRVIDILHPLAEGGTGFIPGPFGCGKTVLQQAISRYANADIIIVIACGERANEVVDMMNEYPNLEDPRTGRKLIERTIMICNTSNMPVAAREASIYTGMSIAEYYRNMGLKVLVLADSTSRWAQALREMSNRMEELPGPGAYPVDLSATIANFYSRAGIVELANGSTGSITLLCTVSPPGGNLKEPVTEATQKVARSFYALSQARSDGKRYPAVDPIESYSKYLNYEEFKKQLKIQHGDQWINHLQDIKEKLKRGQESRNQINILGDENVPIEEHLHFYQAELIDFALLQQDAFDPVDASTSFERQRYMVELLIELCDTPLQFEQYEEVGQFFRKLIHTVNQMNYHPFKSDAFNQCQQELIQTMKQEEDE